MNEETKNLLQRLEQATSRSPVDRSQLDEETAMMRESWLALGRLLKATEGLPTPPTVSLRRESVTARSSRWWMLSCVASVVAIFIVWLCWPQSDLNVKEPNVVSRDHVEREQSSDDPASQSGVAEFAWEDDWDRAFNQTAFALQDFDNKRQPHDESLSRLQDEFVELAREFESGSL